MTIHFWKVIQLNAGILSGVLIVVTAYATYRVYTLETEEKMVASKRESLAGELKQPLPNNSVKNKAVDIFFGNNNFGQYSIEELRTGKAIDVKILVSDQKNVLIVKLVDDKILLSFTIHSLDQKIVAVIKDNEWEINPNNYFRRNYDDHAFEVIDQEDVVKFQAEFIDNKTIVIGGFFRVGGTYYLATTKGVEWWTGNEINKPLYGGPKNQSNKVPLIFTYPSSKHFGERVK